MTIRLPARCLAWGERLQRAGGSRGDHRGSHDQPDQVTRGAIIEQDAGAETAGDERGRAPHPHRTVGAADASEPAQRIGVGQRHDRRVEHRGEHERRRDGGGALRLARPRRSLRPLRRRAITIAMRKASCRSACRVASGIANTRTIIGIANTSPDHVGIEALGREPDRQERQLHAKRNEQRGVKAAPAATRTPRRARMKSDAGPELRRCRPCVGFCRLSSV